MIKELTRNDLAAIKRAASNIAPHAAKRDKLISKLNALQQQINEIQERIDLYNIPIIRMTGFPTEDLVERRDGTYVFKYPDTIIPNIINEETEQVSSIDDTEVVEEVETTPAEAPINLQY